MTLALVPLKDLVSAKTRLSGLLRPAERRALAQAMVEDVLATLTCHPRIDRVTLVSDDPGADLLAGKYAVDYIDEGSLGCRGLNPVLEISCDELLVHGDAQMVVLHGDIPLLNAADIDAALQAQDATGGLVIGCDRHKVGTNLLSFTANARPQFAFGLGSCARHRNGARKCGIVSSLLQRPGIGLDIDEPEDVALLLAELDRDSRGHTARLLVQTELGKRLETLLPSLDNDGHPAALNRKAND